MRSNSYKVFFAVLFLILSSYAVAEKRIDIYQDEQLVLDQSETLRKQAATAGLATVILKASGQQRALAHPLIQDALSRAEAYLYRYSYESTDKTIALAGEQRPAVRLLLQFSSSEIQRLLTSAQIPVWFDSRPELLLWIATAKGNRKQAVDAQSLEAIALKQSGVKRGLPLVTPLMDLTDRQQLPAARLWAIDEVAIGKASERYNMDGVLAGRVQQSANAWSGRFLLLYKGGRQYFSGSGKNLAELANTIISQTTAYFATLDAVVVNEGSSAPSMSIIVENITGFEDYAALLKTLDDVPVIASTMVTAVDGQSINLQLTYNGNEGKVLSILKNLPLMQQSEPGSDFIPRFIWR